MNVRYAVLIPACNMDADHCIQYALESAEETEIDLEIYVDTSGDPAHYNKSAALNRLLDRAVADGAEVIGTLDADCRVGLGYAKLFLLALTCDRVCPMVYEVETGKPRNFAVGTPFTFGTPRPCMEDIFGCALWVARVSRLFGQRWDERMVGRGLEDVEHTCRVVKAAGGIKQWQGMAALEREHMILHDTHPPRAWAQPYVSEEQYRIFEESAEGI